MQGDLSSHIFTGVKYLLRHILNEQFESMGENTGQGVWACAVQEFGLITQPHKSLHYLD